MALDRSIKQQLDIQLRAWRNDLLDLSRRNSLLYFRKTRSTVNVEAPTPDEILSNLKSAKGLPLVDHDEAKALGVSDAYGGADDLSRSRPAVNSAASGTQRRKTLVCNADGAQLTDVLTSLERRSNQEFIDKGIWVLYLAMGVLEWSDSSDAPGASGETVKSPIILVPVKLLKRQAATRFQLTRTDDDVVVNPALALKLLDNFNLQLPEFEEDEQSVQQYLKRVHDHLGRRHRNWLVEPTAALGIFRFHKEAIYRDLKANHDIIASHPIVQALALRERNPHSIGCSLAKEHELDEKYPAESHASILDCDASQRQCLVAAAQGHSFIIEGPPGTGKSQTIANVIADNLARGQSVLFVSEKAAALEVVHNRLSDAGLSEFILELHSHKATRKEVAKALGKSLHTRIKTHVLIDDASLSKLTRTRQALSQFAEAMNERREPIGCSVFDVIGQLSIIGSLQHAPVSASINSDLSSDAIQEIDAAAELLKHNWGPVDCGDAFVWRHTRHTTLTQALKSSLQRQLDSISESLSSATHQVTHFASTTGLSWGDDIAAASRIARLAPLVSGMPIAAEWLSAPELGSTSQALNRLTHLIHERRQRVEQLESALGAEWQTVSLPSFVDLRESCRKRETHDLSFLAQPADSEITLAKTASMLRRIYHLLLEGSSLCAQCAAVFPFVTLDNPSSTALATQLHSVASSTSRPPGSWFQPGACDAVSSALEALEPLCASARRARSEFGDIFDDGVLSLDAQALTLRFREVHRGVWKLHPAYWSDLKSVRRHAKSGRVRKQEQSALAKVAEYQRLLQSLSRLERLHAPCLGADYQRLDTDFEGLRTQLSYALSALRLGGGNADPTDLDDVFGATGVRRVEAMRVAMALREWNSRFTDAAAEMGSHFLDTIVAQTFVTGMGMCESFAQILEGLASALAVVSRAQHTHQTPCSLAESICEARADVDALTKQQVLTAADDESYLGSYYRGLETDCSALAKALSCADAIRDLNGGALSATSADAVTRIDFKEFEGLPAQLQSIADSLATVPLNFAETAQLSVAERLSAGLPNVLSFVSELRDSVDQIAEWGRFGRAKEELRRLGVEEAVEFCVSRTVARKDLPDLIRRSALESWLDAIRRDDPRLRDCEAMTRNQFVDTFRDLDRRLIRAATSRIVARCNEMRPTVSQGATALIRAESEKQKRHKPIRELLSLSEPVAKLLKPCWMMSPLSVSQFVPPQMSFDVVVFDEASQVHPADAINCVYRGKSLVVAGDSKQLPPTAFWQLLGDSDGESEEDVASYESILDTAKAAGVTSQRLKWHYRSQHEDLITFSNYRFYDGSLVTFPGATQSGHDVGVELFRVDGIYARGGAKDNAVEARKVVERVLFHSKRHPHLTLGVVAFSEAQASRIELELRKQSETEPALARLLTSDLERGRLRELFVKNLESVQGDERDIIIFSIGYAKDEAGKFTQQFGPLNKSGGERRLNVAITRARRRVEVVSSISSSDLSDSSTSQGARELRHYLEYAESVNRLASVAAPISVTGLDTESPFEESVARVIRHWGYEVVPQVGCAGYRIDLAIKDPSQRSRFCLAIECDGAMYHSSRVARDRDRLRQEVLERVGWKHIHRIWGLDWYWSRKAEEQRLKAAIEASLVGLQAPAQEPSPRPTDVEESPITLSTHPEWVIDYRVSMPNPPVRRCEMHTDEAQPDLRRMILEVVRIEGPVERGVVLSRLCRAWKIKRAGQRISTAFDSCVTQMRKSGALQLAREGDRVFFSIPGETIAAVRRGVESDPDSYRRINQIPCLELDLAIRQFVADAHVIADDQLVNELTGLFGWERAGSNITQTFEERISVLLKKRVLIRRDDDRLTTRSA